MWSDTALKYAAGRPSKELLLIEGTHHMLAARFADARSSARRLLALDSSNAEGWWLQGMATTLDRYVVKDANGDDSTAYDPTTIYRSFQKALALDGSNHQTIAATSTILRGITFERPGYEAGLTFLRRERPTSLSDVSGDVGVTWRALLVSPDSFRFGPVAEVNRATTPADMARSKAMAMNALRVLLDHWLTVGPDEAQAHWLRSSIAELDRNYDEAFEALERSFQLDSSWSLLPADWERLRLALVARRDSLAQVLGGRLEKRQGELTALPDGGGYLEMLGNAQMLAGRLDAAMVTEARSDSMLRARAPRRLTPFTTLADTLRAVRQRAWSGQMSPQELASVRERVESIIAGQPDSLHPRLRTNLMAPLGFAAANLGDTALVALLRAESIPTRRAVYPGLSALAEALAGNRAGAESWLERAAGDTTFPWPGSRFTAGQAAQLTGRSADALRFHQSVDDASLNVSGAIDFDWIIFARSIKGRGDAALALGDTAAARRHYERFVRLWKDADKQFVPEYELAVAALGSLKRGDRPQVRVIPR
jgi:tetratricopeptide (TPR) repeat protein